MSKEFFEAFGIEQTIRNFEQYNYAQAERGRAIFPERQKLADQGIIKITHKMLEPRPENDCVYWEEMHYPTITAEIREKLLVVLLDKNFDLFKNLKGEYILCDKKEMWIAGGSIKEALLKLCIQLQPEIQEQVKELF